MLILFYAEPYAVLRRRNVRRPASAPVRFFGQRPETSPGYEKPPAVVARTGRPLTDGKQRGEGPASGCPSREEVRPDLQGPQLAQPPAAWGVRCAAATAAATAATAADKAAKPYPLVLQRHEEVVTVRGNAGVRRGSVARQHRNALDEKRWYWFSPEHHHHHSSEEDFGSNSRDRHKRERSRGSGGMWLGLLEGPSAAQGAGGALVGVSAGGSPLGLAISPSPWGGFLSGQSNARAAGSADRKRRCSTRHAASRASALARSADHARARPRSAHAAAPSIAADAVEFCRAQGGAINGGGSGGGSSGSGSKSKSGVGVGVGVGGGCGSGGSDSGGSGSGRCERRGGGDYTGMKHMRSTERLVQGGDARRRSRGLPPPSVDRLMTQAGGVDQAAVRQGHGREKMTRGHSELSDFELAVVAGQMQPNRGFSKVGSEAVDVAPQTALSLTVGWCRQPGSRPGN